MRHVISLLIQTHDLMQVWKNQCEIIMCLFDRSITNKLPKLTSLISQLNKISIARYFKLLLNRFANNIIRILFLSKYNDFTNAFKIYKRTTLLKLFPIVSENFNVFLELPLKIITRKLNYKIISINWYGRKIGESKFKIKEVGSKYVFTMLYCLLEKILLNKR